LALDIHAVNFLKSLPFFSGLPEKDVSALFQASRVQDIEKDEMVFLQGDRAQTFYVIMNGWIKLYRQTPDGEESILSLSTRTETFGDAVMFDGANYPYGAQAAEKAKLVAIPAAALKERSRENPDIVIRMMQSQSQHMNRLRLENEHLSLMSAPQRVGCLLLQLSTGMKGPSCTIHFPYDKSLAATRLGMKPETFSRALGQLKATGVAVKGGDITISDLSALAEYCCSQCSAEQTDCGHAKIKGCAPEDCAQCGTLLKP
jgi:CRP-like cAMP-binding protein